MSSADTIFALATPPGKSGVAIIRLSGSQALKALQRLSKHQTLTPRQAQYLTFYSPITEQAIDRGLALYFNKPHSFTGEDVVELHVHGSLAVIHEMLELLATIPGLRHAEPGEFSRRAFINGKMDLMEVEGLADLIAAETPRQKTQAMRQMQGELSGFYSALRQDIIHGLAHLEAYIDFPDEEIPESVIHELEKDILAVQTSIVHALQDQRRGERLRDGLSIVILGAPNVGKSSLLNMIGKRDAAIVSHRAGTTRDIIEIHLDIAGFPAILVDTAGLRHSDDEIEAEGIRRALQRAGQADIKLVLFNGETWPALDKASRALMDSTALAMVTKSDLLKKKENSADLADPIFISAKTGEGVDLLLKSLEKRVIEYFSHESTPFITRQRHRSLLMEANDFLEASRKSALLELRCEELRLAAQAIGKITGKIQVDDVLDVIFKSFCIGK